MSDHPLAQSSLIGASGEYYVMYRLLRRGFLAALAPQGAPNADIIATSVTGEKTAVIQVKTRRDLGRDGGWHMHARHEGVVSEQLFYCFVDLTGDEVGLPAVFVIPSAVVARTLRETHGIWLASVGRNGRAHQPTDMRRLLPDYSRTLFLSDSDAVSYGPHWMDTYRENWHVLGLE